MSPGPDFFLVLRNSLLGSRRLGQATALGIILGNVFYVLVCSFISLFVASETGLKGFLVIKILGGLYLGYLGLVIIFNKSKDVDLSIQNGSAEESLYKGFLKGFLSMILNGKAAVYFFSVVPQFISADHATSTNIVLAIEFILLSCIWFLGLSYIANLSAVKESLSKYFRIINRIVGYIFLFFAVLLLLDAGRNFL